MMNITPLQKVIYQLNALLVDIDASESTELDIKVKSLMEGMDNMKEELSYAEANDIKIHAKDLMELDGHLQETVDKIVVVLPERSRLKTSAEDIESDIFDELNSALIVSVKTGNIDDVKNLLENEAKLDATDEKGKTPLMIAAEFGHQDIIELLLQEKADLNEEDYDGNTALMLASLNGYSEVVKVLLENGAKIETINSFGFNALGCAAMRDHIGIAMLLIDKESPCEGSIASFSFLSLSLEQIDETEYANYIKEKTEMPVEEFNNRKILGHRFAIRGNGYLQGQTFNYEGYQQRFTYPVLADSVEDFFREKGSALDINEEEQKEILDAIRITKTNPDFETQWEQYESGRLMVIPAGWPGHSTTIVAAGDRLIKGNKAFPKGTIKDFGLSVYKIRDPKFFTKDLVFSMTERYGIPLHEFLDSCKRCRNSSYFNFGINRNLDLSMIREESFETHNQKAINCPWAAAKLAFRGCLYMKYLDKDYSQEEAKKLTEEAFKEWRSFDLKNGLNGYLEAHKKDERTLDDLADRHLLELVFDKCMRKSRELMDRQKIASDTGEQTRLKASENMYRDLAREISPYI